MNQKNVCIKIRTCYYFDDIIKIEELILLYWMKSFWFMAFRTKL